MNTQAAMEWLLMHGEDEDIDAPITEQEQQHILENERNFVPDDEVPTLSPQRLILLLLLNLACAGRATTGRDGLWRGGRDSGSAVLAQQSRRCAGLAAQ